MINFKFAVFKFQLMIKKTFKFFCFKSDKIYIKKLNITMSL